MLLLDYLSNLMITISVSRKANNNNNTQDLVYSLHDLLEDLPYDILDNSESSQSIKSVYKGKITKFKKYLQKLEKAKPTSKVACVMRSRMLQRCYNYLHIANISL